jgi:hypothetical protein
MQRQVYVFGPVLAILFCVTATSAVFSAVGDPTGTTYGVSGRGYGQTDVNGNGFGTFGADLLTESEYTLPDDLTGDAQLGPGGGSPIPLTFDGTEEIIGNLAFNESHAVYDGSGMDIFNPNFVAAPLTLPFGWTTPGHLVEFSVRDTLGTYNEGGGLIDVFSPNIIRFDDVNTNSTAVPVFPADRPPNDPALVPYSLDNTFIGTYFFFRKGGLPANPANVIDLAAPFFSADHPTIPGQTIFFGIGQYDQFDLTLTHDIGTDTFGVSSDTYRDTYGLSFLDIAQGTTGGNGGLGFVDAADEIDEMVFGYIYRMIADSDGNEDGKVDGLDYLKWAGAFGTDPVLNPASPDTIVPAPGRTFNQYLGDYNSDGKVDGLDYLRWASEFGFVGDGSDTLSAAVPEPCSLALACFALTSMGLAIRRLR